jgi:hypothetical protein
MKVKRGNIRDEEGTRRRGTRNGGAGCGYEKCHFETHYFAQLIYVNITDLEKTSSPTQRRFS